LYQIDHKTDFVNASFRVDFVLVGTGDAVVVIGAGPGAGCYGPAVACDHEDGPWVGVAGSEIAVCEVDDRRRGEVTAIEAALLIVLAALDSELEGALVIVEEPSLLELMRLVVIVDELLLDSTDEVLLEKSLEAVLVMEVELLDDSLAKELVIMVELLEHTLTEPLNDSEEVIMEGNELLDAEAGGVGHENA
jgi:hypothetical protein